MQVTEIQVLTFFLFFGAFLAPVLTSKFFLNEAKIYIFLHRLTFLILLAGAALNQPYAAISWLLFCSYGLFIFLKNEYRSFLTVTGIASGIPFIFSMISSVWFVAGVLDMRLLGYDRLWSFYAALHGGFIGWMFVGCLAFLAQKKGSNRIYLIGCYLSFLFFLLVAFGIDGIPFIKRVGVIGFSVMIPVLIGYHALNSNRSDRISLSLSLLSFCAIFLSMSLALLNEFWTGFPRVLSGISTMVLTHGFLNVIVAVPCFFLAILRNIKVEQLAERTKKTQRLLRF